MLIPVTRLLLLAGLALPCASLAAPTTANTPMSSSRALGMSSTASPIESPLLQAQRLYAQGEWILAAEAYEGACALLPKVERVPCRHWGVLALSQTGTPEDFWRATARLDTLLSLTEPEDPYFAELLLTRSRLHLMQGNAALSVRTWKMASAALAAGQLLDAFQLCEDIALQDTTISKECQRVKPKEAPLLAVARSPVKPNPVFRSSSSVAVLLSSSSSSQQQTSSSSSAAIVKKDSPESTVEKVATASSGPGWVLQLGAFSVRENAGQQVETLKKHKIQAHVVEKVGKNRTLYLVRTDVFSKKQDAMDFGAKTLKPLKLDYQVVSVP